MKLEIRKDKSRGANAVPGSHRRRLEWVQHLEMSRQVCGGTKLIEYRPIRAQSHYRRTEAWDRDLRSLPVRRPTKDSLVDALGVGDMEASNAAIMSHERTSTSIAR